MKKSSIQARLLTLALLGVAASAPATTIYVNDNWGAAPTRSNLTFPYEDREETRILLNVQNGNFYSASRMLIDATGVATATAGPAEDGMANGLDYMPTGAEKKIYFDNSAIVYQALTAGAPITNYDDPSTTAIESLSLTYGTNAFGTYREALAFIGQAGASGVTKIVIDSGFYYESLVVPPNVNVAAQAGTSYSRSATNVTMLVANADQKFANGDQVFISGTGNPAIDGLRTINAAPTSTSIRFASTVSGTIAATPGAYTVELRDAWWGTGNSLAGFEGEMATNFMIAGNSADRPVFTRGAQFRNESTEGLTITGLVLNGIFGTNGDGVHANGYNPSANTSTNTSSSNILTVVGAVDNSAVPFVDPGNGVRRGYRKNLTIRNTVFDAQGIRVPFGTKLALSATTVPGYTTLPARNNIVSANGGRGGFILNGEIGTFTFEDNVVRGVRSFTTLDTNGATGNTATWTTINFNRNTISDVWGSSALRGEDPRTPVLKQVGIADSASIQNNTFRDLCVGALTVYVTDVGSPDGVRVFNPATDTLDFTTTFPAFVLDHNTQGGGFLKVFNIRAANVYNNSFIRAGATRDWFQKGFAPVSKPYVPPGHPDFLPMGAGLLIRDVANANNDTDFSNYQIIGNLFESVQQGIAVDEPGTLPFVPGGLISGNTFLRCLTGFFSYTADFTPFSLKITNNVFAEPTNDPLGSGITPGVNQPVAGGIVLDTRVDLPVVGTTIDFTDNFFQSADGTSDPNGIAGINVIPVNPLNPQHPAGGGDPAPTNPPAPGNITGEASGEFETVFPNFDTDGDGLADNVETVLGTNPNLADTDSDGYPDGVEARLGLNPLVAESLADSDNDNLPNSLEVVIGSLPNDPDSDDDGIRDDYEVQVGTNPRSAAQLPSFGDANEDGTTNATDATRILEAFLRISVLNLTNRDRVDINRDGRVDNVDAVILYQKSLGNIPYVPFP